jgi:excisionase family DNA binding protein
MDLPCSGNGLGSSIASDRWRRCPIRPIRLLACSRGMAEPSDLVGTSKAAELLGVSQNRVRQLINSGQLPANRVARTFVIRRADLDAFAALPRGRPRYPRRVR